MSSHIRGHLTQMFNRISGHVTAGRMVVAAASGGVAPTEAQMVELRRCQKFIAMFVPKIEEKVDRWEVLIGQLEDEARQEEQGRYDNYLVEEAHFVGYLASVHELSAQIDIILEEAGEGSTRRTSRSSSASTRLSAARRALEAPVGGGRRPVGVVGDHLQRATGQQQAGVPCFDLPLPPPPPARDVEEEEGEESVPMRLPKLDLCRFNGDPKEWQAFSQCYDVAVHKQRKLPKIQKMTYLVSLLDGEAKRAVSGYAITAANYDVAYGLLKMKYGEEKVVAGALEAELINLPQAGDSLASLQRTSEALDRICRQFEQLGVSEEATLVLTTAKSKLPRPVLLKMVEAEATWKGAPGNAGQKWGMSELRAALKSYIAIRVEVERCDGTVKAPRSGSIPRGRDQRRRGRDPAAARVFAVKAEKKPAGVPVAKPQHGLSCLFCHKPHRAVDCREVLRREDRVRAIVDQKRCFRCLWPGHAMRECRRGRSCGECGGSHHVVICPKRCGAGQATTGRGSAKGGDRRAALSGANATPVGSQRATVASLSGGVDGAPFLMTCQVNVSAVGGRGQARALVFLDPGSQLCFVKKSLADRLNAADEGQGGLAVYPFGEKKPRQLKSAVHSLLLERVDGGRERVRVHAVECIGTKLATLERTAMAPAVTEQEPDILLGLPEFWRLFSSKEEVRPGAVVVNTKLGAVLCGDWEGQCERHFSTFAAPVVKSCEGRGEEQVKEFWDFETLGIRDSPHDDEDEVAERHFEETVERRWTGMTPEGRPKGRYAVEWPWRDPVPDLSSNYSMAFSRTAAIHRRLQADLKLAEKAVTYVDEQLEEGHVKPDQKGGGELEHFLPLHLVLEKFRLVGDAAAHAKGEKSLNQCLLRGPVVLPQLIGCLMRFRSCRYPVLADIRRAFLQLELKPPCRKVVKFLWFHDVNKPFAGDNVRVLCWARVPFGVVSSPWLLAAVIRRHLRSYSAPPPNCQVEAGLEGRGRGGSSGGGCSEGLLAATATELEGDTYVDNVLLRCESEEEVRQKSAAAKQIFAEAEMELREFESNERGFINSLPSEQRLDKSPKVLGIPWRVEGDQLVIEFPTKAVGRLSRRIVLKALASVYDPLGLVAPCLLEAKLQFQNLWDTNREWDSPLSAEEEADWRQMEEKWLGKIIVIPRRTHVTGPAQLHACVDASEVAYACCVYVRQEVPGEQATVALIYAKSRLRPKRTEMTIPKMELMAMRVGVRALSTVAKQLHMEKAEQYLWGDSKVALAWINAKGHLPRFVANGRAEIRRHEAVQFAYVPTAENPADLGTKVKPCNAPEMLQNNRLWWEAPGWLKEGKEAWPSEMLVRVEAEETEALKVVLAVKKVEEPSFCWLKWGRFQCFYKWVRVFAYVKRFVMRCRRKVKPCEENTAGVLSAGELKAAEVALLKVAQLGWEEEASQPGVVAVKDEDGIMHLKTRMKNSELDEEGKSPILLMKQSPLARLLMEECHLRQFHSGVDSTLTEYRLHYFSRDCRKLAKSVCKQCQRCKQLKGPSYGLPEMPDLPADRVRRRRAFQAVGVDYLGPTSTRSCNGTLAKCWLVLITCLTTRAVYLEPVWSLSALDFAEVFRRFCARRGRPDRVLSDNGSQFRAVEKLLSRWRDVCKIEWRFIGALSPWQGGVYERLVALTKSAFKAVLGRRVLAEEAMRTLAAEVEAGLNRRPLTYVSGEADAPVPLRPLDFIAPAAETLTLDKGEGTEAGGAVGEELKQHWEELQSTMGRFWRRFRREYLPLLRDRSGWLHRGKRGELRAAPEVGQVVLVEDLRHPRNLWPLARVVEVEVRAGAIRNARLKLASGQVIGRPINRIYPLEGEGGRMVETAEPSGGGGSAASQLVTSSPERSTTSRRSPIESASGPRAERSARPRRSTGRGAIRPVARRTHRMVTRGVARALAAVSIMYLIGSTLPVSAKESRDQSAMTQRALCRGEQRPESCFQTWAERPTTGHAAPPSDNGRVRHSHLSSLNEWGVSGGCVYVKEERAVTNRPPVQERRMEGISSGGVESAPSGHGSWEGGTNVERAGAEAEARDTNHSFSNIHSSSTNYSCCLSCCCSSSQRRVVFRTDMSSEASKKLGRAVRFGIELNEEQKLCVRERRFGTDPKLPVVSKPLAAKASQGLSSGEQFQKGRVSRKREKKKLKRKRRRQLRRAAVAATKAVAAQLTSNRSSAARTPPSMSLSSSRFVTLGLLALVGKVEAVGAESATWGLNAGQWAIPVAMAVVAVIAGGLMRALWSRKPTRDKGQCDCREKWLKYRAEVSELNKEWGEYLQHLDGDIDSNSSDIGRQGASTGKGRKEKVLLGITVVGVVQGVGAADGPEGEGTIAPWLVTVALFLLVVAAIGMRWLEEAEARMRRAEGRRGGRNAICRSPNLRVANRQQWCAFCRDLGHTSAGCAVFPRREQRMAVIRAKGLCSRCLVGNHATNMCRSWKSCRCGLPHHFSICPAAPSAVGPSASRHGIVYVSGAGGSGEPPPYRADVREADVLSMWSAASTPRESSESESVVGAPLYGQVAAADERLQELQHRFRGDLPPADFQVEPLRPRRWSEANLHRQPAEQRPRRFRNCTSVWGLMAVVLAIQVPAGSACSLTCESGGVMLKAENTTAAYWCCGSECRMESGPTLQKSIGTGNNVSCDVACEGADGVGTAVNVTCKWQKEEVWRLQAFTYWAMLAATISILLLMALVTTVKRAKSAVAGVGAEAGTGCSVVMGQGMVEIPLHLQRRRSTFSGPWLVPVKLEERVAGPVQLKGRIGAFLSSVLQVLVLMQVAGTVETVEKGENGTSQAERCGDIDCVVCFEFVANPICFPYLLTGLYAATLVGVMLAACWCVSCLRNVWSVACCCWQVVLGAGRCRGCRSDRRAAGKKSEKRKKWRVASPGLGMGDPLLAVAVILLLISAAQGAVSSTAYTESCFDDGENSWCEWNYATTLTVLPAGQVETLQLRDGDALRGELSFTSLRFEIECVPETAGWVYGYTVGVKTVKRCPGMGSCGLVGCKAGHPGEVEELGDLDGLGCIDSCSHWWCGCPVGPGLAQVAKACLFYGLEVVPDPNSSTAHIFTCPVWQSRVQVGVKLKAEGMEWEEFATLHPGLTHHFGNVSMTLLALSPSPAPVLGRTFVSDGQRTAMVESPPGELQCESEAQAERRECRLGQGACSYCEAAEEGVVKCQCAEADINSTLSSMSLPKQVGEIRLESSQGRVYARSRAAPIQIHLQVDGLRLVVQNAHTKCYVKQQRLEGVYNHPGGALLRLSCRTDTGEVLAAIECGQVAFAQKCSDNDTDYDVHLTFGHAHVEQSCNVSCTGGETQFQIQGDLLFVTVEKWQQGRVIVGASDYEDYDYSWRGAMEKLWDEIRGIDWLGMLLGDWRMAVALVVVAAVLWLGCSVVTRLHPVHRGYRLLVAVVVGGSVVARMG